MSLLEILVLLPLLAAAGIGLGLPAKPTAMAAAVANLLLGLFVYVSYDAAAGGFQFASSHKVLESPELNLAFAIDGLSLVLLLLTVIVTFAAVCMSPAAPKNGGSAGLYHASSLLISAGALGAFLSTDVFFLYAFHELALIPTFLMIGMFGTGPDRRAAAWKITIYLGAGSLILLAGLLALVTNASPDTGLTFDLQKLIIAGDQPTQAWIYGLLIIGFGILISLFPFHSWAAPAYAAAPTPTAMLHAGVLKKFGLYGIVRLALPLLPEGANTPWVQTTLLVLLLGNILFVGLVTIAQKRLDTMLGNSSVMHMGYLFLGIASASAAGMGGAVILMFAHGISIALLFALCSKIEEKTGTVEFEKLGGLMKSAPFLGVAFGIAAFASIGLPGFANFSGEILVFFGGFSKFDAAAGLKPLEIATLCALWGVVISAVYMLRAYRNIFQGDTSPLTEKASDISVLQRAPLILLAVVLLIPGLYPNVILKKLPSVMNAEETAAITPGEANSILPAAIELSSQ